MSSDHFGFKEEPFAIKPILRFFYCDAARQHVHAHLVSSIRENKGLIFLTGERGIGKTILLRHLADKVKAIHGVALLPPSGVLSCESSPSFGEILRVCCLRSNARDDAADDEDDESGLAKLLERCKKANAPVALILDGADHLPLGALERLKALSALSADERGRLTTILSGCLDSSKWPSCSFFEAAQIDVDVSLRLQRFQDRDVQPYICHRVQLAGRKGPALFTPEAIERIIHYSRGNPLSINRICRSTLIIASRQTIETVSAEMVDGVVAGDLPGTTAESSWDSGKRPNLTSVPELPRVPKENATDFPNDRSHPPEPVLDKKTPVPEDEGDKFFFRDETGGDAGRTAESAALVRIPRPQPLEDFTQEERVGRWSQDRVGMVVRSVWIFLAATLVFGVTGVYLAQTGQFDAIEFSKRWMARISVEESELPESDPRGLGLVEGRPSHWVEPSSMLDREYPLETESASSSGKAPQFLAEQRQSIGKPIQDGGAPVELGSQVRSDEPFNRASLSTAPRSIPALDATSKKGGPDTELTPATETNEAIDRPQLAVTTNSGVVSDETINITGSPIEIEPSIRPDEAGEGREFAQESGSVTDPGEDAESLKLAVKAGSTAEADEPAASHGPTEMVETVPGTEEAFESGGLAVKADSTAEPDKPMASQAVPVKMETVAGIEEAVESDEMAVDAGSAAETDELVASQAVPAEMEPAAGIEEAVESGGIAVEAGSAAEADEPVASQAVPVEMEPAAGIEDTVEISEAVVEAGSAAEADEPAASQAVPVEMGPAAGIEEAVESGGIAVEAGSAAEADEPAASQAVPVEMEPAAGIEEAVERSGVAVEAGSAAEADEPVASRAVPVEMEPAAGIEEAVESGGMAVEAGSAAEADEPAASQAVPVEMGPAAGIEEAVEISEAAVEAGSAAEADEPAASQAVPVEMETVPGIEEAVERSGVAVEAGSAAETDEPVASQAVPVEMETVPGIEEAVERSGVAVEAGSAAETDEPAASQAVPVEMETAAGSEEAVEISEVAEERESAAKADELVTQFDRSSAETPVPEVNDDLAANLRSASTANGAQEVMVPVTARVDLLELRDLPQGRPEPQPSEPEVLAPGDPPTPIQVAESTQSQLDLDRLIARGDQLLALGDVASARLFYRLAAMKGSARGATAMGSTYDPVYLERIGIVGARPSPAEAIKWYRQAIDMGNRGAEAQLRELTNRLERAAALGDGEAQRILEGVRN